MSPINGTQQPVNIPGYEIANPKPGELYRLLPDGRWALFFDSSTLANFTKCEQYGVYNTINRLRLKGPQAVCISIGSWWSKVSEKFYTECAASIENESLLNSGNWTQKGLQYLPITRMAQIALEAWVEEDMDSMRLANPDKYEKFAMPVDASMFASMLGLQGFDHQMFLAYKAKAIELRSLADSAEQQSGNTPENLLEIQKMRAEANRLEQQTVLPLGPILMACQYYNQYAENDFRNWKIIGAEKPFGGSNEVFIGEDNKVMVFYQGRPDLVVYETPTDSLMPLDQKTKDYITNDVERIWKPHSQTAGYIYAVQKVARDLGFDRTVDRCLISVCARNVRKTAPKKGETEKPRFRRVRPTYSPQELQEWQATIMRKANRLREALEYNSITRCDGFNCHVYGGCEYRQLCAVPAGSREMLKTQDYIQVKPWSPLFVEDED